MSAEPVTIVFDHPGRHLGRRFLRWLGGMVGVLLLTIGLLASIPAVPASIAVASFVVGWIATEPTDPEPWPPADMPVRQIVIVWAIAAPIAIAGIRGGLRLVRRNRRLVLFLRRFGYDEAQSAVTFAVARVIGGSWRLVTLDDAEMTPIGVAEGTRALFRFGGSTVRHLIAATQFLGVRMFPILVLAMWGVVALAALGPAMAWYRTGATTWEQWAGVFDPFLDILGSVFEWQPPIDYVGPSLPGVFAVLAMAAALSFGVMIASVAAIVVALPLSTVLFFVSASADAVREAEKAARATVNTSVEVRLAARDIARKTARVFGPRIVVLRVASAVWQEAVRELAAVATLPLIDISEPTDNVAWEIDQLLQLHGRDCVFIGHHERLLPLAAPADGTRTSTAAEARVREMLAGRDVLAYTTDPAGLRRFARALRGTLITRQID